MPMKFFDENAAEPAAWGGRNLQYASGLGIRPAIGGKRRNSRSTRSRRQKRSRRSKGGFTPSIMGSFTQSAAQFITPMSAYAAYKLFTDPTRKNRSNRR